MRTYFLLAIFILCGFNGNAQNTVLKKGLKISRSTSFLKRAYSIVAPVNMDSAVIYIEGDNIAVDFKGTVLNGSSQNNKPDAFHGVAVIIRNSKNVTVRNLTAKGYKVALLARNVTGLHIENCDFSYNYRQRLKSTQEREDLSDLLGYEHNENDEWLRYGAALYLRGCSNATINNCKVTGGQNGLMLMECNGGLIYNNNLSFNSGVGLGMYKCIGNRVLYNKLDFNVRGYSDGVFSSAQNSAGIFVFEQSSNNLFYKNSATHGGIGFTIRAGKIMNSETGGCNDNLLLDNDFSYASASGVEVMLSRNQIIHNRIFECDYGIWGDYSFQSRIGDNQFRNNKIAIAIRHGQYDTIHHNLFINNPTSVKLWSMDQQPPGPDNAQYRKLSSKQFVFVANSFNQSDLVYDLLLTDSVKEFGNVYNDCGRIYKKDSTVEIDHDMDDDLLVTLSKETSVDVPQTIKPNNPFKGNSKFKGRKNIRMTEWGPYDYSYPFIWLSNPKDTNDLMRFELLGPSGKWKIISTKGLAHLNKQQDTMNTVFTAKMMEEVNAEIEIKAIYTGKAFIDQFGNKIKGGKAVLITFVQKRNQISF